MSRQKLSDKILARGSWPIAIAFILMALMAITAIALPDSPTQTPSNTGAPTSQPQ